MISSSLARFPKGFLVSSPSDGTLQRFVDVSTDDRDGGCISTFVISSSSSSSKSKDKSKSVRLDELPSLG